MGSKESSPKEVSGEAYAAGRASGMDVLAIASSREETAGLDAEFVCITCGVQYPFGTGAPAACPICDDERQYVGWHGQLWTTLDRMQAHGYQNVFREEEPGLESIETVPPFAIGQRALLVQTPKGNILWDCLSYIDDATIEAVRSRGGLEAIAISHPHFYSSMSTWSRELGGIPVYVHSKDAEWVQHAGPWVRPWDGTQLELLPGLTLVNCGGHFPGSTVLHWSEGAGGEGALLAGDTIKPVMDRRYVSFMYSIVNLIPLGEVEVRELEARLDPFEFQRIYSLWNGHMVVADGKVALKRSVERYLDRIRGGSDGAESAAGRT